MKKLVVALLYVSLSTTCIGQDSTSFKTHKNTVYFNPLSVSLATANISYERFLNQRFSMRIGFLDGHIYPEGKSKRDVRSLHFTGGYLELRKYTRTYPGKTPEDFYFGPYLQAFYDEITDYQFTKDSGIIRDDSGTPLPQSFSVFIPKMGVMAGSRQIYFKRLAIDLNAGLHYQHPSEKVYTSTEIINLMARKGVSFRIGLHAGFCF